MVHRSRMARMLSAERPSRARLAVALLWLVRVVMTVVAILWARSLYSSDSLLYLGGPAHGGGPGTWFFWFQSGSGGVSFEYRPSKCRGWIFDWVGADHPPGFRWSSTKPMYPYRYWELWYGQENIWSNEEESFYSRIASRFMLHARYGVVIVVLPYWFVFIALAGTVAIPHVLRRARSLHRRRFGLCLTCGYDLRATPDHCPECGTVVQRPPASPDHPAHAPRDRDPSGAAP
jgi:hypothetical protein